MFSFLSFHCTKEKAATWGCFRELQLVKHAVGHLAIPRGTYSLQPPSPSCRLQTFTLQSWPYHLCDKVDCSFSFLSLKDSCERRWIFTTYEHCGWAGQLKILRNAEHTRTTLPSCFVIAVGSKEHSGRIKITHWSACSARCSALKLLQTGTMQGTPQIQDYCLCWLYIDNTFYSVLFSQKDSKSTHQKLAELRYKSLTSRQKSSLFVADRSHSQSYSLRKKLK